MNILEFLTKLDTNLNNSFTAFQTLNKNISDDNLSILSELIKKNNINLYKYLDLLMQVKTQHLSNINIDTMETTAKPFVFSFNIDNALYNKNFKHKFKETNQISVNTHKLKAITPDINVIGTKNITIIDSKDISPNSLNLPVIKDLKAIPPMFYWYDGDKYNKKGIYICMSKGFNCRVPFPNMMSTVDQSFKINSIPCKYQFRENCLEHKKKISELFNSEIRECHYVHKQEKFIKIGSFYRCNRESFGNHDSLTEDMNYVNTPDIKRILMHSLSDSLLSVIWYQNKFKDGNLLLNNLEIY